MKRRIAIDAFCGAGGLSLGLARAGFDIGYAFDNDPIAVATHRTNLGGICEKIDVSQTSGREILGRASLGTGDVALLAGGPPCQGFSLQRRGPRQDERNKLVLCYLELLEEISPTSFLIENVPAIRSVRGKDFIIAVQTLAQRLGYDVHMDVLDAADFGVAQHRKRAFIVGVPRGANFAFPKRTVDRPKTVREALNGLESPPEDGSPHPVFLNHYRESRLSALNLERIRSVPEGGGRADMPPHLWLKCHQGSHRHLDTYGRLSWDAPSVTITARFDSFTRGRFGHPSEDRSITLREGALLQSFPRDFFFLGNREQGARLIGNAVPPLMGEAVGRAILQALEVGGQTAATLF